DVDGKEILIIVCQEKNDDNTNCNTSYVYTSGSTGNAISEM
ncbi:31901_t:CDS:1, partial [Racocetra persica]